MTVGQGGTSDDAALLSIADLLIIVSPHWQGLHAVLADRRAALVPLVAELHDRQRAGNGLVPADQLTPGLMHMHANRLGLDRAMEQLVFSLLERTLRSLRAYPATGRV